MKEGFSVEGPLFSSLCVLMRRGEGERCEWLGLHLGRPAHTAAGWSEWATSSIYLGEGSVGEGRHNLE